MFWTSNVPHGDYSSLRMQYCICKVKIIIWIVVWIFVCLAYTWFGSVKSTLDPYCRKEVECREPGRAELERSWTNTLRCLQQPTAYISGSYPKPWAKASDLTSSAAAAARDQWLLFLCCPPAFTSFSYRRTVPGSWLAQEYGNGVYRLYASASPGGELRRQAGTGCQQVISSSHWRFEFEKISTDT